MDSLNSDLSNQQEPLNQQPAENLTPQNPAASEGETPAKPRVKKRRPIAEGELPEGEERPKRRKKRPVAEGEIPEGEERPKRRKKHPVTEGEVGVGEVSRVRRVKPVESTASTPELDTKFNFPNPQPAPAVAPSPTPQPSAFQPQAQPSHTPKKQNNIPLIIAITVVAIAVVATGLFFLLKKSDRAPQPYSHYSDSSYELEDSVDEEVVVLNDDDDTYDRYDRYSSEPDTDHSMEYDILNNTASVRSGDETRYFYSGYFIRNGKSDPITVAFIESDDNRGSITEALYKNDTYGTIVRMNADVTGDGIYLFGYDNDTPFSINLTNMTRSGELTGDSQWGSVNASVNLTKRGRR
ncbi:MAG: hypothetical protein HDR89_09085 [Bacteroides sp.]|nr:hypothetical protein [Bacteroides sp.]